MTSLTETFGGIDIYLFDQLLKGRLTEGMRVLDAGCGTGRNLVYLLRQGVDVRAVDADPDRIEAMRALAARLSPGGEPNRFQVARVERLPFEDGTFEFVISSAVLHFAPNEAGFLAMVREMWRVLAPNGVLFARLASTIGLEGKVEPLGDRRFRIPDGTDRFLVDQALLLDVTGSLGGALLDPIKTTIVQEIRAMTTWVLQK